jgi:hypothetical protein
MIRRLTPARRLGALAALIALPLLVAAMLPVETGTTYQFTIKSQSSQTGNRESVVMKGRGTFAGDNAKIEIEEMSAQAGDEGGMFGSRGSYFLALDGGKRMLLVDPAKKTYMEWNLQSMMSGMTKMMGALGGLMRMEMSDVSIQAQEMGSGGTVNGYATNHVRITEKYTMSARVLGRTSTSKVETTTDYYIAPALRVKNPFMQSTQAFSAMGDMFNNADYQRQAQSAYAKINGVPVKTVTRSVTTQQDGKQEVSLTTAEMSGFQSVNVAASTFAVPSGFQAVEMPNFDALAAAAGEGGAEGAGGQSIGEAAREGAAEGAREATKDAAKDAVKGAIGGLRGRIKK